ncbi:unnamed protein product [Prorocentrum cordatum]|uniref:Uncharacterized protein n=1 Tax=Prorocentrum cordatum TaxID=2364126 RepID=A0ABN9RVP5_9DINO|nr:unnamed protein product [Polarella glacialis]
MTSAQPPLVARCGDVEIEVRSYFIAAALVARFFAGEAEDGGSSEARRTAGQVAVGEQDDGAAQHVEGGVVVPKDGQSEKSGSALAAIPAFPTPGVEKTVEVPTAEHVETIFHASKIAVTVPTVIVMLEGEACSDVSTAEVGDTGEFGSNFGEQLLDEAAVVGKSFTEGGRQLGSNFGEQLLGEGAVVGEGSTEGGLEDVLEPGVFSEVAAAEVQDKVGSSLREQLTDEGAVVGKGFTEGGLEGKLGAKVVSKVL